MALRILALQFLALHFPALHILAMYVLALRFCGTTLFDAALFGTTHLGTGLALLCMQPHLLALCMLHFDSKTHKAADEVAEPMGTME